MMWPPPSTVVMVDGTVSALPTGPQSAVNVKVLPLIVPVHTVVMSPPEMGGAALATPPPPVKTKTPTAVIATMAKRTRNRDITTSRTSLHRRVSGATYHNAKTAGGILDSADRDHAVGVVELL
jgi:hypothetical protein